MPDIKEGHYKPRLQAVSVNQPAGVWNMAYDIEYGIRHTHVHIVGNI